MCCRVEVADVNDNAPQFDLHEFAFSVSENEAPVRLGAVRASDADAGENARVTYELLPATGRTTNAATGASTPLAAATLSDLIAVDARTGDVSLRRPLDREAVASLVFRVAAADAGTPRLTSNASVVLTVRSHRIASHLRCARSYSN